MNFTISELHFIKRQLEARIEWIKDNPGDFSEEEGELPNCITALNKLKSIEYNLESESISNKKGCGKEFDYDIDMPMICGQEWNGRIFYCEECQESTKGVINSQQIRSISVQDGEGQSNKSINHQLVNTDGKTLNDNNGVPEGKHGSKGHVNELTSPADTENTRSDMQDKKPHADVIVERAGNITKHGIEAIRAVAGTDEEYKAYVNKYYPQNTKNGIDNSPTLIGGDGTGSPNNPLSSPPIHSQIKQEINEDYEDWDIEKNKPKFAKEGGGVK